MQLHRTISTVSSALFVVVTIAMMASVASADHKAMHNPGGDTGGVLGILVVRDGNGAIIGEVVNFGDGDQIRVAFRGDPAAEAQFF